MSISRLSGAGFGGAGLAVTVAVAGAVVGRAGGAGFRRTAVEAPVLVRVSFAAADVEAAGAGVAEAEAAGVGVADAAAEGAGSASRACAESLGAGLGAGSEGESCVVSSVGGGVTSAEAARSGCALTSVVARFERTFATTSPPPPSATTAMKPSATNSPILGFEAAVTGCGVCVIGAPVISSGRNVIGAVAERREG